jgi:hypothetical protein
MPLKLIARKRFSLVQCVKYQQQLNNKKAKYLVVHQASLHGNLLAQQPDLVVLGKQTVLSVEPWDYQAKMKRAVHKYICR